MRYTRSTEFKLKAKAIIRPWLSYMCHPALTLLCPALTVLYRMRGVGLKGLGADDGRGDEVNAERVCSVLVDHHLDDVCITW